MRKWGRVISFCGAVVFLSLAGAPASAADDALAKLHEACRCSDLAGLPIGAADLAALRPGPIGKAALHWAVEGLPTRATERLKIVASLLDRGADVNQLSGDGLTPLQHACRDGWDRPLLDLLLARGAVIDAPSGGPMHAYRRGTALHRAAQQLDPQLVSYLIEKKANPRIMSMPDRETPLHRLFFQAPSYESEKVRARTLAVAKTLLTAGADPNSKDARRWTALHHAAFTSHFEALKELLGHGASIEARTANGSNVMHCAVMNEARFNREVLTFLHARAPVLLDTTDADGETPLHIAVRQRNNQGVQTLLLLGASPTAQNKRGQRPIDKANDLNSATMEMLLRYTPPAAPPPAPPPPAQRAPKPVTA
jgi:ankyrin repeat protein